MNGSIVRAGQSLFLEGLLTDDSKDIPERRLDLLTGYVEVGILVAAGLAGVALLLLMQ